MYMVTDSNYILLKKILIMYSCFEFIPLLLKPDHVVCAQYSALMYVNIRNTS